MRVTYEVYCFKCDKKTEHEPTAVSIHGIDLQCIEDGCGDRKIFRLVGYQQSTNFVLTLTEEELKGAFEEIVKIVKEGTLEASVMKAVYGKGS